MDLELHVDLLEELTAALRAALDAGDETACGPLLEQRAQALTALDAHLRLTTPVRRVALQPRLEALAEADRELRLAAATGLAQAADAFRNQCGAGPRSSGAGDRPPTTACLDRRA